MGEVATPACNSKIKVVHKYFCRDGAHYVSEYRIVIPSKARDPGFTAAWICHRPRRSLLRLTPPENLFHPAQIILSIHANSIVRGFPNLNRNSVFQKAQLLEPLASFQWRLG